MVSSFIWPRKLQRGNLWFDVIGRSSQNIEKTSQGVEEEAVCILFWNEYQGDMEFITTKNITLSYDHCNTLLFIIIIIIFFLPFHSIQYSVFLCCGMLFIFPYANHLMIKQKWRNFALKCLDTDSYVLWRHGVFNSKISKRTLSYVFYNTPRFSSPLASFYTMYFLVVEWCFFFFSKAS